MIRIWLTQPDIDHELFMEFAKLWQDSADSAREITGQEVYLQIVRAKPGEEHWQLLERIWAEASAQAGVHVIADLDFVPEKDAVLVIATALLAEKGYKAMFAPRCHKIEVDPVTDEHSLLVEDRWPFCGSWFLAVRVDPGDKLPPPDWLRRAGLPTTNEPCELAAIECLRSGFCSPEEVMKISWSDAWPEVMGARYPGLGVHVFCSHEFNSPPETKLFWSEKYTVAEHLQRIWNLLDRGL